MVTITTEEISLFYAVKDKKVYPLILNNILNCLVCRSKSLFKNVK